MQFFTKKRISYPVIRMQGQILLYKSEHRLLGMILDSPKLNWREHVKYLIRDGRQRLDVMKSVSSPVWGASAKMLRTFYIAYIRSKLDYGSILYDSAGHILQKLEVIQNSALRMITGARKTSPILSLQVESHLPSLGIRRGYLHVKRHMELVYSAENNYTAEELLISRGFGGEMCYPDSFNCRLCPTGKHILPGPGTGPGSPQKGREPGRAGK